MIDAKVQNPSFRTLTFSGKNDTGCLSQSHETPFISSHKLLANSPAESAKVNKVRGE